MPRRSRPRSRRFKKRPAVRRAYRRKRMYRRRKNGSRVGDSLVYKGIGVPSMLYTKLRYTQQFTLTAGVGSTFKTYQFRGNALYDPDFTGTGAQPEWLDQLNGIYQNYVVSACKINVRCAATGDTFATGNADICLIPNNTLLASTYWSTIDDMLAAKGARRVSTARGYTNAKYISGYAKSNRILEIKDINDNLATAGAIIGSTNPTSQWYWQIGMQGMDRTSTTASVNFLVTLTYYVRLFNTYDVALS